MGELLDQAEEQSASSSSATGSFLINKIKWTHNFWPHAALLGRAAD
jgi:hypothetical protein